MKSYKRFLLSLVLVATLALSACHKPSLEGGGAYKPGATNYTTNADSTVTGTFSPQTQEEFALYVADSTYRMAYQTVYDVLEFERTNRDAIKKAFPSIALDVKHALDKVRPVALAIDQKWARARKAYRENPTPAGLTVIQSAIAEIQRLIPTVQAAVAPVFTSVTSTNNP